VGSVGLFGKKLSEDECIVALVALRMLKRCLDSGQELAVTARDVAELGLEKYGIEIPENLAEEALEKLVKMGIMRKSEKGYTLTDIVMYVFTASHSLARKTDSINLPDIVKQAMTIAVALRSSGYSTAQLIKARNTLKSVVECGLKSLEKLAKSVK
jgi:hypothetical protein